MNWACCLSGVLSRQEARLWVGLALPRENKPYEYTVDLERNTLFLKALGTFPHSDSTIPNCVPVGEAEGTSIYILRWVNDDLFTHMVPESGLSTSIHLLLTCFSRIVMQRDALLWRSLDTWADFIHERVSTNTSPPLTNVSTCLSTTLPPVLVLFFIFKTWVD